MKLSMKAIDNPLNTSLFVVVLMVLGVMAFNLIPLELNPEIETPTFFVTVEYPGASPSEIEFKINQKLEDELKNLDDIKNMSSIANQNYGTVVVEFRIGTDIDATETKVKQSVDRVEPDLPSEIETPVIQKMEMSKQPIFNILIYREHLESNQQKSKDDELKNDLQLKYIAEELQKRIERISGVSKVNLSGVLKREISLEVDPVALWANNVSLTEIINFFNKGNLDFPGGKLQIGSRDYTIKLPAKFLDEQDIEETILTFKNDKPIYLKDLGKISFTKAEVKSNARINGIKAIALSVVKQSGGNLVKLSDIILNRLEKEKQSGILAKGIKYEIVGDQAKEVRQKTKELTGNIYQGIAVVFLVLLFSMGIRNAFIASLAIPFAMIFALGGLYLFDQTLNMVTQFGLIIVVGIVVDGAIVVMENTYRHLELGEAAISSAKIGIDEVGSSVISSALTTMAAFAPMLFMTGIIGEFMAKIPLTVIIALFGSLLFDHIVIPLLCSKFLKVKTQSRPSSFKNFIMKYVSRHKWISLLINMQPLRASFTGYQKLIRWSISHPYIVLLMSFFIFFGGVSLLLSLDSELFPEMDSGRCWVEIELPKGSSVKATNKLTLEIEQFVEKYRRTKANPDGVVKYYSSKVGTDGAPMTSTGGAQAKGPNISRIDIDLVDEKDRTSNTNELVSKLRPILLSNCTGGKIRVRTPSSGPPVGAPINLVITGDKLRTLKSLSNRVQAVLKTVPGAIEIRDDYGLGRPEISMPINRTNAQRYGVSVQEIQNLVFALLNGYKVADYQYGQDDYEIRVKIKEESKRNINDLKKITIFSNKYKKPIPITEFVDINIQTGSSVIIREDYSRAITVMGEVDKNLFTSAQLIAKVKERLKDFNLPTGYDLNFRGEDEETAESFQGLKYSFIFAVMLIYCIVVMQLKSFAQPMAIIIAIPLSVTGIALGLYLSGSNIGIMAIFGAVSLAGIVVNGAIVLVSYINLLRERENSMRDAIIAACETRVRPIFLTTFTTVGGLLPLALALGSTNSFFVPMGWAIIGGLMLATLQLLIAVPVLYVIIENLKNRMTNVINKLTKK